MKKKGGKLKRKNERKRYISGMSCMREALNSLLFFLNTVYSIFACSKYITT